MSESSGDSERVLTKESIVGPIREHRDLLRGFGVRRLALFGSFVRGEQKPDSDVDLLIEFADCMKSFDNFMKIVFFLEDLLGRPVELVTAESLSPYIGPHILRELEYVPLAG